MKNKKILTILFLGAVLAFILKVNPVLAYQYNDEDEGPREIYIDKTVSLPRDNDDDVLVFKDNLSDVDDERYEKDQIIVFELKVKNTGEETISKITVKDKYPEYIDFPGDSDNWNDSTQTYTYEITDLEPDEEDIRRIEGRVTTDAAICVINTAEVNPEDADADVDTAKLCIGKRVLGVSTMPETGPSPLFALIALGLTGVGVTLKRKK